MLVNAKHKVKVGVENIAKVLIIYVLYSMHSEPFFNSFQGIFIFILTFWTLDLVGYIDTMEFSESVSV